MGRINATLTRLHVAEAGAAAGETVRGSQGFAQGCAALAAKSAA